MADTFTLELNGLDEFRDKLNQMAQQYPYETESLLEKMGKKFRTEVKKDTPVGNSKKKKLINRYKLSAVYGYGTDLNIDFYSNSPHFHLIERGHKVVSKTGKYLGKSTRAFKMVELNAGEFARGEFPREVERMLNRLLRVVS